MDFQNHDPKQGGFFLVFLTVAFIASPAKYVTVGAAGTYFQQRCSWKCVPTILVEAASPSSLGICLQNVQQPDASHSVTGSKLIWSSVNNVHMAPSGLLLPSLRALPLIEACYLNTLLSALSPRVGKILCIDIYCLRNSLHRPQSPEFPQTLLSNIRLFVFPGGGILQVFHTRPGFDYQRQNGSAVTIP